MIEVIPYELEGRLYKGISVKLPKTNLLVISGEKGYIMCGALDVALLNAKLSDRKIIAGRAIGVRTLDELLNAPLESVTVEAVKMGITEGMAGREALILMEGNKQ